MTTDNSKDLAVAIVGASVALAGLLLVFIGFVFSRADALSSRRGDTYRLAARLGLVPFVMALVCAALGVEYLDGSGNLIYAAVLAFRASLLATALYAFVVIFGYL